MDENKIPLQTEDDAVDADAIMAEFDRESNTRIFTGWRKAVITAIMSLFSVYMISMALVFQNATKYTKLTTFLAFIVFIGFLIFPAYKKQTKKINYVPFYRVLSFHRHRQFLQKIIPQMLFFIRHIFSEHP